jgi:hypothetical protein
MRTIHPFEIVILTFALGAGIFLFVRAWMLSDAVPLEYRSASPGFNWGWEFDYKGAMRSDAVGEKAWPWPAKKTGSRMLLPLNQPLVTEGLELTYQGMVESDGFRLDVVIQSLDADVTYPQEFSTPEARKGFSIADQQFVLEKITPRYLLLNAQSDDDR